MRRTISAAAGLALICALPAPATMVKSASLDESIDASLAIVAGSVVSERSARLGDGTVVTVIGVRVEESLKGPFAAGRVLDVTAWGGERGGRRVVALGEAVYRKGERVLLQLERIDGRLHTLGLAMGKWSLVRGEDRDDHLVRSLAGLAVAGPAMTEGPLALDDFRARVLARAAR